MTRQKAKKLLDEGYNYVVYAVTDFGKRKAGDIISKHKTFATAWQRVKDDWNRVDVRRTFNYLFTE